MTRLAQGVAGWVQRMSQVEMGGNLQSDGKGWAKETKALEESV